MFRADGFDRGAPSCMGFGENGSSYSYLKGFVLNDDLIERMRLRWNDWCGFEREK